MRFSKSNIGLALLIAAAGLSAGAYYYYIYAPAHAAPAVAYKTPEERKSVYVRFDMEAYDKITEHFWMSAPEGDLAGLFQLALQKAANTETPPELPTKDRAGVAAMLARAFEALGDDEEKKQSLARDVLIVALYNLPPQGRGGLLSRAQEKELRETVANIHPDKDLYQDLGLERGASAAAAAEAAAQLEQELQKQDTPEAKEQLERVAYAKEVLANEDTKTRYDQGGVEPTVTSKLYGQTLYVHFKQIAPTTIQEFGAAVVAAASAPRLDSMIIDLRGNKGGALDFAVYFLGLFIGKNQFAFDLYRKDSFEDQRTAVPRAPELERFRELAVLTDNMTQSTAEVVTAAFKRYNLGVVVGGTTRGWGSVENTYPLETTIDDNTYSLFLVNSITLRDDNEPIEGRGVDPHVNIADANWKQQLPQHITSQSLINALRTAAALPPLQ